MYRPGVYYENSLWYPGEITFMGEFGSDSTTLDAGGEDCVFAHTSRTPHVWVIVGLTLTNAGNGVKMMGDNIALLEDVKVINCDTAIGYQGIINAVNCQFINGLLGIQYHAETPVDAYTFENCHFEGMTDKVFRAEGPITLIECTIQDNSGTVAEVNSAVYYNPASMVFDGCTISSNGNGITCTGVENGLVMNNCLYSYNGGGVYYSSETEAELTVQNCTFAFNNGSFSFTFNDIPEQYIIIDKNILAFNEIGIESANPLGGSYISCCDVYGNTVGNYSGVPDQTGQNDNISLHPMFCDPESDNFYLSQISPCLPGFSPCGELIGVFAAGCGEIGICGDANGDDFVNILDVTYLVDYLYLGGPPPVIPFYADVNSDGAIDMLDVTYLIMYLYQGGPEPNCTTGGNPYGWVSDSGYCKVDYKGSDPAPNDSGCIEWEYDGYGSLILRHYNAVFNCCTDIVVVDFGIGSQNIYIVERDSLFGDPCPCLCLWDLEFYLINIAPGTYRIRVDEPYLWEEIDPEFDFTIDLIAEPSGRFCLPRTQYPWGDW
jgi:hypothetical protein